LNAGFADPRTIPSARTMHPIGPKGFTKAGIRKMIARLHEEMAVYEGSEEAKQPHST
jgi:hypothetical protein